MVGLALLVGWSVKYDVPLGTAPVICGCLDNELWPVLRKLRKEKEEGKVTVGDLGYKFKCKPNM